MKTMDLEHSSNNFMRLLAKSDMTEDSAPKILTNRQPTSNLGNPPSYPGSSLPYSSLSQGVYFTPPLFAYSPNLIYVDLFSEDDILPSDIDETALNGELEEEEALDAQDTKQCEEYEQRLWRSLCNED